MAKETISRDKNASWLSVNLIKYTNYVSVKIVT